MIKELLDQIYSYLNGLYALRDLESWVVSNLQRILDSGEAETIELANRIDADLIGIGESLMEETTLREYLQSYISSKQTIPITSIQSGDIITATAVERTTQILGESPDQVQTVCLDPDPVPV